MELEPGVYNFREMREKVQMLGRAQITQSFEVRQLILGGGQDLSPNLSDSKTKQAFLYCVTLHSV